MKIDLKYIIKDIYKRKDIKYWLIRLGNQFDNNNIFVNKSIFPEVITNGGNIFRLTDEIFSIEEAARDYFFNDIRKDDIVIDIGANIGGFCIPASNYSNSICAVEPIMIDELHYNIKRNNANIRIVEGAVGNGSMIDVTWHQIKKVQSYTFNQIKDIAGGCTFLKCDCEGFEWFIQPEDLNGIRRIEMEIHNYNPSTNNPKLLLDAIDSDFNVSFNVNRSDQIETEIPKLHFKKSISDIDETFILHAKRK
jgi:hypothetical protein